MAIHSVISSSLHTPNPTGINGRSCSGENKDRVPMCRRVDLKPVIRHNVVDFVSTPTQAHKKLKSAADEGHHSSQTF